MLLSIVKSGSSPVVNNALRSHNHSSHIQECCALPVRRWNRNKTCHQRNKCHYIKVRQHTWCHRRHLHSRSIDGHQKNKSTTASSAQQSLDLNWLYDVKSDAATNSLDRHQQNKSTTASSAQEPLDLSWLSGVEFDAAKGSLLDNFNHDLFSKQQHHEAKTKSDVCGEQEARSHNFLNYLETCVNAGFVNEAVNCVIARAHAKILPKDPQIFELMQSALLHFPEPDGKSRRNKLRSLAEVHSESLQKTMFNYLGISFTPLTLAYQCAIAQKFIEPASLRYRWLMGRMKIGGVDPTGVDLLECYRSLPSHHGEAASLFRSAAQLMDFKFIGRERSEHEQQPPHFIRHLYQTTPNNSGLETSLDMNDLKQALKSQLELEKEGEIRISNVTQINKQLSKKQREKIKRLEYIHEDWEFQLTEVFENQLRELRKRWSRNRLHNAQSVYPFLCVLPIEDYIDIIIRTMRSLPASGLLTIAVCNNLGHQVYSTYVKNQMLQKEGDYQLTKVYKDYLKMFADSTNSAGGKNMRLEWDQLQDKHETWQLDSDIKPWSSYWKNYVGTKLLEMMVSSLTIDLDQDNSRVVPSTYFKETHNKSPAVYHSYQPWGKGMYGITLPHPTYTQLLADSSHFVFNSNMVPMILPPRPWINKTNGGFLLPPTDFVRAIDSQNSGHDRRSTVNYDGVSDALNVLSSVAWKINQPILDVQLQLFENGGNQKLQIPPPESAAPEPPSLKNIHRLAPEEKTARLRQYFLSRKLRREYYALYCFGLYTFSIASHYRDSVFWLPHNMDFRGRVYPIPPHFNYMGADCNRALFKFAEGRPLGERGVQWLKTHIINLTGLKKKSSNYERLQYADQVMDEIMDSADRPMDGRMWWSKSEEPWQTLASCIELTNALRSGSPHEYISHLPIHQDGSCNGLQHYAAMGRDSFGAQQVNLSPAERPEDIYMGVAQNVEMLRSEDEKKGLQIAAILNGFVTRKVVKQTVMTTVYGVTRFGGSAQIYRQLSDLETFPDEHVRHAANYLVDLVFQSIGVMFSTASEIQRWLRSIANVLSRGGIPVEYITPLGLYVQQPYYKPRDVALDSRVQRLTIREQTTQPNTLKQCNAFPPNFVHSLDATHMMMTALNCHHEGITFASVHDCYWTHACDVDRMNSICRQQFVNLHSEPILEQMTQHLSKFLTGQDNYPVIGESYQEELRNLLETIPKQGDFNLDDVKASTYFFC